MNRNFNKMVSVLLSQSLVEKLKGQPGSFLLRIVNFALNMHQCGIELVDLYPSHQNAPYK